MKNNIFNEVVNCIDASISDTLDGDLLEGLELLEEADEIISKLRKKYKVKKDQEIGNADAWDNDYDNFRKEYNEAEARLFKLVWEHIKVLMFDCGVGEVAREVAAENLFDVKIIQKQ